MNSSAKAGVTARKTGDEGVTRTEYFTGMADTPQREPPAPPGQTCCAFTALCFASCAQGVESEAPDTLACREAIAVISGHDVADAG